MERLSGYALSGALLRLWALPEAFGGLAELQAYDYSPSVTNSAAFVALAVVSTPVGAT